MECELYYKELKEEICVSEKQIENTGNDFHTVFLV